MQAWKVYFAWDGKPLEILDVIAAETHIQIDEQFHNKLTVAADSVEAQGL